MPFHKRYFFNHMEDYKGGFVHVQREDLKEKTLNMLKTILKNWKKTPANCDGSLYVGLPGAAYAIYRLTTGSEFQSEKGNLLKECHNYMKVAEEYADSVNRKGRPADIGAFLLGNAGIYAISAVVSHGIGDTKKCQEYTAKFAAVAPIITPINWLDCGGDELLVGRAGYLFGVLWMMRELKYPVLSDSIIDSILDTIVESGQRYSQSRQSHFPLMYRYYDTEYLGAAHGLAGILFALLCFPRWLKSRPHAVPLIRGSLDALLSLQSTSGNFPCALDEVGGHGRPAQEELVHWCHGAPGTVYAMAKAYQVFQDEKYLQCCMKCGDVTWEKGLLKKGPGICHGIAGSGYVFLILYRLTGDQKHLHRALQFLQFMDTNEFRSARTPDSPYSLYEGLAGTLCFVADCITPDHAEFPFFPIFQDAG